MSKSRGNIVNPDDVVEEFGADSLRLFEMFMGPLEQVKPWATKGVEGGEPVPGESVAIGDGGRIRKEEWVMSDKVADIEPDKAQTEGRPRDDQEGWERYRIGQQL